MRQILLITFLISSLFLAFSCSNKSTAITSISDLNGRQIGVQTGTTSEFFVQENLRNARISEFKTGTEAAQALLKKEIDAIIIDELPAKSIIARNESLKIIKDKFYEEEYAIAVKKGNKELLDSINKTIKSIKKDGTYQKLVNSFICLDGNVLLPIIQLPKTYESLKMGTNAAFPPFEYVENDKIIGFDITLSEYIARDYGRKLEIVDKAFDSLIPSLMLGSIDFIAAGMTATEERKNIVDFSEPYYKSTQVIIVRK